MYRFDSFHPFIIFLYYVSAIAAFMLCMHPAFLTSGIAAILLLNLIHDRGMSLRKWLLFIISTGIIVLILNPLFNERGLHVLFEVFGHRVTLEALIYGGMNGLSIMGITMIFVNYNEIMTPNKLLFLFSKTLPKFAVLLMLTLRFIPLMKRRLEEIAAIQKSKGISVGGSWKKKAANGLLYVQVLMTYSLEEAIQTADSMKARGYGKPGRSAYSHYRFRTRDALAAAGLILFLIVICYGRFGGYGYLTVYPIMENLKIGGTEGLYLAMYLVLLAFPIFFNIGGLLWWRKLK